MHAPGVFFAHRALLVMAFLGGCAATTQPTATANDAGADAPSADAPSGPCRWTAGALVDNVVEQRPRAEILDVVSRADGAAVLVLSRPPGAPGEVFEILWLDARGRPVGEPTRLATVAPGSRAAGSMVFDPARGALTALVEDPSGCHFVVQNLATRAHQITDVVPRTPGFSLGGCRWLLPTPTGYSYLAEEIRALWGVEQVNLDAAGRVLNAVMLPVPEIVPGIPYTRVRLGADRSVVGWTVGRNPAESVFGLARATLDASTVDPPTALMEPRAVTPLQLVAVGDNALGLWDAQIDNFPPLRAVAARTIDALGRPTGATVLRTEIGIGYLGGLAGTFARGDVLLTAALAGANNSVRLVVLPSRPDGAEREPPVELPVPPFGSDLGEVRIVTVSEGALVVASHGQGMTMGRRVIAVPLRCGP